MNASRHEPLRIPANRDKLLERAFAVDEESISVGGLAAQLGFLGQPSSAPSATGLDANGQTLALFVQLSRRERGLTPDEFARQCHIELEDVVQIEGGRRIADARVLHRLGIFLKVSTDKLQVLAGLRQRRDTALEQGALRFAASSGPMERLTPGQAAALHEFVRILHD